MRLFVLIQLEEDGDDVDVLGVFSSLDLAKAAQSNEHCCVQEFDLDSGEGFLHCHWLKDKT